MEDRAVVEQILSRGKTNLFALVVKKYQAAVFAKALGITKRTEAAKEVTQQTFVSCYMRLADWRGRELGPWLTAIACHRALNYVEKEKRRQRGVDSSGVEMADEEYAAEREQRLQRMEEAIEGLAEGDRAIIRLHYYQRMKTDEIARRMGITQANVLVRLHRIRERLKKHLQDETD